MADQNEPGEGHSPAAWTGVIIALLGITVGTLAFWFDISWLVWTSVGIVALGPIVGIIIARAGYGVYGPKYQPKEH